MAKPKKNGRALAQQIEDMTRIRVEWAPRNREYVVGTERTACGTYRAALAEARRQAVNERMEDTF